MLPLPSLVRTGALRRDPGGHAAPQRGAVASLVKPCSGQSPPPGWKAQAGLRALGNQLKKKKKKREREKEKRRRKTQKEKQ